MTVASVIGGVPVVHARRDGTTTANLMFRVGQGDEALAQRGITHLVEHLALFPLGIREHHANGQTGVQVTNFHATGTPDEIVSFLNALTTSLSSLPCERLESEKLVLRTEESQRNRWMYSDVAIWRFGAQSDGLASYPEWGRDQVTPDQLLAWRDEYFTSANAVLLIVGPTIPEGIELALPRGRRHPVPPLACVIPAGRTSFSAGEGAVMFEAIVDRSTEATVVAQILNRLMYQELRLDAAYSYTAGCVYEPRDATHAFIRGYADALDEQVDAVIGAMVDLLARVRHGLIDESLITDTITTRLEALDDPDLETSLLASEAHDLLLGSEPLSKEGYRARLVSLNPERVRATAADIMNQVLLQVPHDRRADWGGFEPLALSSDKKVQATSIYRELGHTGAFHVGPTGVSRVSDGVTVTVLFEECAALLVWPDGRRVLMGRDGFVVEVEPHVVERGDVLVSLIDQHVDPARAIARPARAPEDIPPLVAAPATKSGGWLRRRQKAR